MFTIDLAEQALADLKSLRAYERAQVLPTIKEQLTHELEKPTRNKKLLAGLKPTWEMRVGDLRVFYDMDVANNCVTVQAVCRKPRISPRRTSYESPWPARHDAGFLHPASAAGTGSHHSGRYARCSDRRDRGARPR